MEAYLGDSIPTIPLICSVLAPPSFVYMDMLSHEDGESHRECPVWTQFGMRSTGAVGSLYSWLITACLSKPNC